jgi:CDP-diacylglycerol--serine O-phosphatidyltransferase
VKGKLTLNGSVKRKFANDVIRKNIPTFFTLGNLFVGVLAIVLGQRSAEIAVLLIILCMLLDGVDGRLARKLNAESDFGKELDSLSDVISFGVAPAVLTYSVVLKEVSNSQTFWPVCLMIACITSIFPICGALRLARFNVASNLPVYFVGLPITAAGTILACLSACISLLSFKSSEFILLIVLLILAYLMISRIKYSSLKKRKDRDGQRWPKVVYICVAIFLFVFIYHKLKCSLILSMIIMVMMPFIVYALSGFKTTWDHRGDGK